MGQEAQRPTAAAPTGARLMLPSGALLAICFFLPAVKVCDQATAPYQIPATFPPYLFGLLIAVIAAVLLRRRAVPALLRWGTWALATCGGGALAVGLGNKLAEVRGFRSRAVVGAFAAAAVLSTGALLLVLRRGRQARWRLSRTALAGGALSVLWCLLLLSDGPLTNVCYGLWLSLLASLGLLASGLLLHRDPA